MRSTLGRLVGRGALLAALGVGSFAGLHLAAADQDDASQLATFEWHSIVPDDEPVGGDDKSGEVPTGLEEDFTWI